ncbi:OLC1v1003708C1 [Oldenlandia corymbosa var. corymbosa]|uniref:OLC1v1003708C1 n=1 Tax=Oldenlandia corymbosa var. corymbosa TaxID=529605 RepID=A0AAV1DAT3_OLDCO|nr:OLC1v1003708C1 [Oldenlandia corymbosa var. corymbosa]
MKGQKRSVMAKRGLRSLGLAVGLPLSLTLLDIALFGSNIKYATMEKPFWYPPLWALHSACLVASSLIGLSAWLVWVEGGFHRNPTALLLCLGAVASGLSWDPIVFRAGANKLGLVVCAAVFGLLVGCMRSFKTINPIAGDLVKPCLLWPLMLSLVNFKLVYH